MEEGLFDAIINKNDLQAKHLIDAKADANAVDENGITALWRAIVENRPRCVEMLLEAKANVDAVSKGVGASVHIACNNAECLRLLIEYNVDVNMLNSHGYSAMHLALLHGNLLCVQILVAAGADVDKSNGKRYTPLAHAIDWDYRSIAEILLRLGAKISNLDSSMKIPAWMHQLVEKRKNTMLSTLTLKGVLKWRCGISKDASHLIAIYFWNRGV
jgi:ankyrin repeat protein